MYVRVSSLVCACPKHALRARIIVLIELALTVARTRTATRTRTHIRAYTHCRHTRALKQTHTCAAGEGGDVVHVGVGDHRGHGGVNVPSLELVLAVIVPQGREVILGCLPLLLLFVCVDVRERSRAVCAPPATQQSRGCVDGRCASANTATGHAQCCALYCRPCCCGKQGGAGAEGRGG